MKLLVLTLGICLHMAGTMAMGYRLHRLVERYAPGIAAWIPPDGGAILGFVAGAGLLAWWIGP
jgi:hypothetical protein